MYSQGRISPLTDEGDDGKSVNRRRNTRRRTRRPGLTSRPNCSMSPDYPPSLPAPASRASDQFQVLVELQRRLAETTDNVTLKRVVSIIEQSGNYQMDRTTFDFDLCRLDDETVSKLRQCLNVWPPQLSLSLMCLLFISEIGGRGVVVSVGTPVLVTY